MARTLTLNDLEGENAFVILGAMGCLLRQLDRAGGTKLQEEYEREATSGDYAHLWETTVQYADDWLADTLSTGSYSPKEKCWYCDGEGISPDEEDEGDPCPECHGARIS